MFNVNNEISKFRTKNEDLKLFLNYKKKYYRDQLEVNKELIKNKNLLFLENFYSVINLKINNTENIGEDKNANKLLKNFKNINFNEKDMEKIFYFFKFAENQLTLINCLAEKNTELFFGTNENYDNQNIITFHKKMLNQNFEKIDSLFNTLEISFTSNNSLTFLEEEKEK